MKKIFFLIVFVLFFSFLKIEPVFAANFMESVGIKSTGTQNATAVGKGDSSWLRFAQSVNSEDQNIISWSGYPIISAVNHITALIVGYPDKDGKVNEDSPSALGFLGKMVTSLYDKPVSSGEYVANLGESIGIMSSQKAYASPGTDFLNFNGSGFLKIWVAMRNLSYVFFVIVMVAIGFMVMFRFKINPQTVATIQSSIPKIVLSLLLVTFSYALCGFMVDLVYLGNGIIVTTFVTGGIIPDPVGGPVKWDILTLLNGGFGGISVFAYISNAITNFAGLFDGSFSPLVNFIIAITLLTTTFQIFFALLTKYITIIISTIFMPLAILWGTVPGQEDTFPKLFKSTLSAALSFPAVYFFLILASYVAKGTVIQVDPSLPPFNLGATTLVGVAGRTASSIVALGIIMATAKIPSAIDDALSVRPGLASGTADLSGALRRIPIIGSILG